MLRTLPFRNLLSILSLAALMIAGAWFARAQKPSSASTISGALPQLQQYVSYLQEFSQRRRANSFFTNTQSIFDGVQVNFVNVGRGNLTFARRDLVTTGRMPVVLNRVYDSMSRGSADFGVGWTLSAAERIETSSGSASLFTESGTRIDFAPGDNGFVLARDYPSDYSEIRKTGSDSLVVPLRNGTTKEFRQVGRAYRLTRVTDRNGNQLRIVYSGELVVRIENDSHSVSLLRDRLGRIAAAYDHTGRQVSYTYDTKGRLSAFTDTGGNVWNYAYSVRDQLESASDPQGRNNFQVGYEPTGRVQYLKLPTGAFRYQYDDGSRSSIVTDGKGWISRYRQNHEGITVSMANPLGEETSVTLDQARNARQLSQGGTKQFMDYDQLHRLSTRRAVMDSGQITSNYYYDHPTGQLTRIVSSNGTIREFSYDERGNLIGSSGDHGPQTYGYSASGDLTSIAGMGSASPVAIAYNETGQISRFTEGPGLTTEFQYDQRGRMAQTRFSDRITANTTNSARGFRDHLS